MYGYVIVRSACFCASRVHVCDSPPPTCHVYVSVAVCLAFLKITIPGFSYNTFRGYHG